MTIREDPRITRSRAAILHAGLELFLEHGYVGGNLDEVAALAGVSKKTVYNVVGDKQELFRQVVWQAVGTADEFSRTTAARLSAVTSVEPGLRDAALTLARTVLGGPVIRLRRLLIGEVERFPQYAREYYDRAPGQVMRTLADVLQRFSSLGLLSVPDPNLAAEHLAFLVMGAGMDRALFAPSSAPPPDHAEVDASANAGFDVFLAAYGAGAVSSPSRPAAADPPGRVEG